jgi:secondary thiamine-phosphate synthase enzyme
LVTDQIERAVPEIRDIKAGVAHVFIKHTSASLTLNENADPTVRADFESHFDVTVPEGAPYYRHTSEGPDDMPAHLKASLNLGTWQGIYLCEHRDHGGPRRIVVTLVGE